MHIKHIAFKSMNVNVNYYHSNKNNQPADRPTNKEQKINVTYFLNYFTLQDAHFALFNFPYMHLANKYDLYVIENVTQELFVRNVNTDSTWLIVVSGFLKYCYVLLIDIEDVQEKAVTIRIRSGRHSLTMSNML